LLLFIRTKSFEDLLPIIFLDFFSRSGVWYANWGWGSAKSVKPFSDFLEGAVPMTVMLPIFLDGSLPFDPDKGETWVLRHSFENVWN
jgi:hypothetical protein